MYDCSTDSRIKRPNHNTPTEIIDSIKIEVTTTSYKGAGRLFKQSIPHPLQSTHRILIIFLKWHNNSLIKPLTKVLVIKIIRESIKSTAYASDSRFRIVRKLAVVDRVRKSRCDRKFRHTVFVSLIIEIFGVLERQEWLAPG